MNKFFITGATGVVGSALVAELLANSDCEFQLLLRAKDDADLQARLDKMLQFWDLASGRGADKRITALRGDVTWPLFGLTAEQYQRVSEQSSHIVHCAAIVKMNLPFAEARNSAVTSVKSILELARASQARGVLKKVDIVSTVGVAGLTPGLIPEEPLPDVERFHNTYEASKSEAERFVRANGVGLPLTLHRPSMVVGHSLTGKIIHFQVFYHLCEFLSGRHTPLRLVPKTHGVFLDTIPVDYVARAIAYCALNPDFTAGKLFHLCSGPTDAVPVQALVERIKASFPSEGGYKPPRPISSSLFRSALPIMAWVVGDKQKKALRNLPIFLDYLDVPQQFANSRSCEFFHDAGIDMPQPKDYIDVVLRYYLEKRQRR
ncbi:MAG: SDR family oxidoreductase [Burkholderiales bacterium]